MREESTAVSFKPKQIPYTIQQPVFPNCLNGEIIS